MGSSNPAAVKEGLTMIGDAKHLGWSNFDPDMEKVFLDVFQTKYPVRMKKIVMVDAGWFFRIVFKLIKPFMSAKMKGRLSMGSGDVECISQWVPEKSVHIMYGGGFNPE